VVPFGSWCVCVVVFPRMLRIDTNVLEELEGLQDHGFEHPTEFSEGRLYS
jgi:hypothetical protein